MAKSGKVGRPRKYNKREIEELKKKLKNYIEKNKIPIIAEFCYKNNILKQILYDYAEFATLIKEIIYKKEANLEKGLLANQLNSAGAIFSLKQLGWSDKHSVEQKGNIKIEIEFV